MNPNGLTDKEQIAAGELARREADRAHNALVQAQIAFDISAACGHVVADVILDAIVGAIMDGKVRHVKVMG